MDRELLLQLYGRTDWSPILALKFEGDRPRITWCPKADEARKPEWSRSHPPQRIGVWGGAVETYDKGFNQQPVELVFIGLDIDHKKSDNAHVPIGELPARVAAILPQALVRTSTGGLGVHVFLILDKPIRCGSKAAAQNVAECAAVQYVSTLKQNGVEADIVARNMLWVTGGKQRTIQVGGTISVEWDAVYEKTETVETLPVAGSGDAVRYDQLGQKCRDILASLHLAGLINSLDIKSRYLLHIKPVQDALCHLAWLIPCLTVQSAGTDLSSPNCSLRLSDGRMTLHTFVGGGKTLFSIPLGV